jgi:hypothetical protein
MVEIVAFVAEKSMHHPPRATPYHAEAQPVSCSTHSETIAPSHALFSPNPLSLEQQQRVKPARHRNSCGGQSSLAEVEKRRV